MGTFDAWRFASTLKLAVRNLMLHKFRSLLTVLGLVFGVASVIAMLAIAEGASLEAQRQIAQLGATNIVVRTMKPSEDVNSRRSEGVFVYGLTYDDLERIRGTMPTVIGATALREFEKDIRYLDHQLKGVVVGVTPSYLEANGLSMLQGRFINFLDLDRSDNIVVIGADIANRLFPFDEPLGKSVRIGQNHYYRVIGVTRYRAPSGGAGSSLSGIDYNLHVYIPLTTNRARFGDMILQDGEGSFSFEQVELTQITVAVDNVDNVKRTAAALNSLLGQFHPRNDYGIVVPLELLEQAERTKQIFSLVLGSIASISLLVGGIGIMNIMLATVTERTREIGIRRALGARQRDITVQFLVETAVLSVTGGLLGVVLGLGVPPIVSHFSGTPTVVVVWAPLIAFGVAVLVGVSFGVVPARRAALLDPIEALRAE